MARREGDGQRAGGRNFLGLHFVGWAHPNLGGGGNRRAGAGGGGGKVFGGGGVVSYSSVSY